MSDFVGSCLTGTSVAADANTEKLATLMREMPDLVRQFSTHLSDNGVKTPCIGLADYQLVFQPDMEDIRAGSLETILHLKAERVADAAARQPGNAPGRQKSLVTSWTDQQARNGLQAFMLSAEVLSYDSSGMPLPTIFRIDMCQERIESNAPPLPFDVGRDNARHFVVPASEKWAANLKDESGREPLLTAPLVFRDPFLGPKFSFSSAEAIGFIATDFYRNSATLLSNGFYVVPFIGKYSGLISRVHSSLIVATARKQCDALTAQNLPKSVYMPQCSTTHYMLHGRDLENAVKFISDRLVPANVEFNPDSLPLTVEPFGSNQRWIEVLQSHLAAQHTLQTTSSRQRSQQKMTVVLTVRVYYALLKNTAGSKEMHAADTSNEIREFALPAAMSANATGIPGARPSLDAQLGLEDASESADDEQVRRQGQRPQIQQRRVTAQATPREKDGSKSDGDNDDDGDDEEGTASVSDAMSMATFVPATFTAGVTSSMQSTTTTANASSTSTTTTNAQPAK